MEADGREQVGKRPQGFFVTIWDRARFELAIDGKRLYCAFHCSEP